MLNHPRLLRVTQVLDLDWWKRRRFDFDRPRDDPVLKSKRQHDFQVSRVSAHCVDCVRPAIQPLESADVGEHVERGEGFPSDAFTVDLSAEFLDCLAVQREGIFC